MNTKFKIIELSITLFKEKGFHNVSINEICQQIGITRSAFYHHFKTKDEVLDAYILQGYQTLSDGLKSFEPELADLRSTFYEIMKFFSSKTLEIGPELLQVYIRRCMEGKTHWLAPRDTPIWKEITDFLRYSQKQGFLLNTEEPELLAEASIHMLNGICITWCNKNGNFNHYAELIRMLDLMLHWRS